MQHEQHEQFDSACSQTDDRYISLLDFVDSRDRAHWLLARVHSILTLAALCSLSSSPFLVMMNRSLVLLLVLAVMAYLAPVVSAQPTWTICPNAPTDIAVKSLNLTLANRNLALVLTATVDEQMTTGSQVTVQVNLDGGSIFSENIDMSQGTTLPIAANATFVFKYSVSIPSIAPSGAYVVDLTFVDQTGVPLTCIAVSFALADDAIEEM